MPDQIAANVARWRALHPSPWRVFVWGDEVFTAFRHDALLARMRRDPAADAALICDRVRFLVLESFGGFYMDADCRPLRSLDSLRVAGVVCAFAGFHPFDLGRGIVADSFAMAAEARLPAFRALLGPWYSSRRSWPRAGLAVEFVRSIEPRVTVWPWQYFGAHGPVAGAYALHWPYRLGSWLRP